jgi:hypothetical protein
MTTTVPGILGQNKPSAGVDTNLFTVATGTQVQFNMFVCNQAVSQDQFTIALVPSMGIETSATYIAYNTPITANGLVSLGGLFLNSGDQVRILSVGGNTSFTATGLVITN